MKKKETLSVPAPKMRSITDLLGQIDFSPDDVVRAASVNSALFVEAIEFRRQCLSGRTAAKMTLDRVEADTKLRIRRDAKANGDKITEAYIEELSLTNVAVRESLEAFAKADELDEYSKLVVEAFRMRRDCLRIVGDLMRNEIGLQGVIEAGAEQLSATRRKLRERFPGREE